jgi:cytochrome c peroxidase
VDNDRQKAAEVAQSINNGRALFYGKARCNSCHVGDNFTDNQFHNLGVGVKDRQLPANSLGRFATLPTGHKSTEMIGAFKTPTLRHLLGTAPYLHEGSERTLEEVVDFYDRGGNANEYLDVKMRDFDAERAYLLSQQNQAPYKGPEVKLFGKDQTPIVSLKLNLTPQEKRDLVLFLRAFARRSGGPHRLGSPQDAGISFNFEPRTQRSGASGGTVPRVLHSAACAARSCSYFFTSLRSRPAWTRATSPM